MNPVAMELFERTSGEFATARNDLQDFLTNCNMVSECLNRHSIADVRDVVFPLCCVRQVAKKAFTIQMINSICEAWYNGQQALWLPPDNINCASIRRAWAFVVLMQSQMQKIKEVCNLFRDWNHQKAGLHMLTIRISLVVDTLSPIQLCMQLKGTSISYPMVQELLGDGPRRVSIDDINSAISRMAGDGLQDPFSLGLKVKDDLQSEILILYKYTPFLVREEALQR